MLVIEALLAVLAWFRRLFSPVRIRMAVSDRVFHPGEVIELVMQIVTRDRLNVAEGRADLVWTSRGGGAHRHSSTVFMRGATIHAQSGDAYTADLRISDDPALLPGDENARWRVVTTLRLSNGTEFSAGSKVRLSAHAGSDVAARELDVEGPGRAGVKPSFLNAPGMSTPGGRGRVIEALEETGVPYEVVRIDPQYADTGAFCERYSCPPERAANTIIVASKRGVKKFAACIVPATRRLDVNRRVRRLMGVSRASFASAEQMRELTGMEVGGVTPFALPSDVPIYVDSHLLNLDWIILGAGGRDSKIRISPEVLRKLPNARIVEDLSFDAATDMQA